MTDLPPSPPARGKPADAVLAAELALGVLDPAARARAEARAAQDDAFAHDAADWMARLHPLLEEIAPVAPSDRLWPRIAAALGQDARAEAAVAEPRETEPPSAAQILPFRRSPAIAAWRAAAIGGLALAAASVAAMAFLIARPGMLDGTLRGTLGRSPGGYVGAPLLAAKLGPVDGGAPTLVAGEPLFTATLDRDRRAVVMTPISPGPVDPRARELWLIPKGGKPLAAGMIDVAHIRPVPLSPALLKYAQAGATLAVSLEPQGGSPTGAPTGPVIAAGVLDRI